MVLSTVLTTTPGSFLYVSTARPKKASRVLAERDQREECCLGQSGNKHVVNWVAIPPNVTQSTSASPPPI